MRWNRAVCSLKGPLPNVPLLVWWVLSGCGQNTPGSAAPDAGKAVTCAGSDGTWQGIQKVVLDGYGCTSSACHGKATSPAGGLDLRPEVAYSNLVHVDARASLLEPVRRIFPGEQGLSFLYQKVAAATLGTPLPQGAGQPMPFGRSALSPEHLEVLRLWIRAGAPERGIVAGTSALLGCGLSNDATPNKIDPPPPPKKGEGVQFLSGPWTVKVGTEDEVCFATYYDLTKDPALVPEGAKIPCPDTMPGAGGCFAYNLQQISQDPQSHHSIIARYKGSAPPSDPAWGPWECRGGARAGTPCDPTRVGTPATEGGADCGERSVCGTIPQSSVVCIGWGPDDISTIGTGDLGRATTPVTTVDYRHAGGVYQAVPLKGIILWNSHGFNLTSQDATIEQYNSYWFAQPSERRHLAVPMGDDLSNFVANVPPFEQRTYCRSYTLPLHAHVMSLSSHNHKHGVEWKTWLPPNSVGCTPEKDCRPNDTPPDYLSLDYSDPVVLEFEPPLEFHEEAPESRTLKYCVTYDNGKAFPELLKRNSRSIGTKCERKAYCVGGPHQGAYCGSDHAACGEGGTCDACPVVGGTTTEDEMMILVGNMFIAP